MIDQTKFNAFMEAVRGIPSNHVTQALTSMTPGINWMKCSKRHMAEAYANERGAYGKRISTVKLDELAAKARARMNRDTHWEKAKP